MNMVDINYVMNKFINKLIKRHVSCILNISSILSLDGNHINQETLYVIKKYSKTMDIKKISIMIKYIKYNIKTKLIFYKMSDDDINSIIIFSLDYDNKYYLNHIDDNINITNVMKKNYLIKCFYESSEKNNVNSVLFLAKRLQIDDYDSSDDDSDYSSDSSDSSDDSDDDDDYDYIFNKKTILDSLCTNEMHLNIIKHLQKIFKLTKQDFKLNNNSVIRYACATGHDVIVKYLHKKIKFTKEDLKIPHGKYFVSLLLNCCELACEYGNLDIIRYLHKEFELTKEDFGSWSCMYSCKNGHINVVKYLHKEVGLTKKDFSVIL